MCLPHSKPVRVRLGRKTARLDSCLVDTIVKLNKEGVRTVASCCGHGLFNPTIFVGKDGKFIEYLTDTVVNPVKRRYWQFYVIDSDTGLYRPVLNEALPPDLIRAISEHEIVLPASCRGCGACCGDFDEITRLWGDPKDPHATWIFEDEEDRFGPFLTDKVTFEDGDSMAKMKQENNHCKALDDKKECTVYSRRPRICRTFERGSKCCYQHLLVRELNRKKGLRQAQKAMNNSGYGAVN